MAEWRSRAGEQCALRKYPARAQCDVWHGGYRCTGEARLRLNKSGFRQIKLRPAHPYSECFFMGSPFHHEISTIQFKMQISFKIIFCFYLGRCVGASPISRVVGNVARQQDTDFRSHSHTHTHIPIRQSHTESRSTYIFIKWLTKYPDERCVHDAHDIRASGTESGLGKWF